MDDLIGGLTIVLGGAVFVFAIITLAVAILMIIANIFFRCSTKQFAWIAVREGESNLF